MNIYRRNYWANIKLQRFMGISSYSVISSKATRRPLCYKGYSWPKAIFRDALKLESFRALSATSLENFKEWQNQLKKAG